MKLVIFEQKDIQACTLAISGQRYVIAPQDWRKARLWPIGGAVEIEEGKDGRYQFVIRRRDDSQECIRACLAEANA